MEGSPRSRRSLIDNIKSGHPKSEGSSQVRDIRRQSSSLTTMDVGRPSPAIDLPSGCAIISDLVARREACPACGKKGTWSLASADGSRNGSHSVGRRGPPRQSAMRTRQKPHLGSPSGLAVELAPIIGPRTATFDVGLAKSDPSHEPNRESFSLVRLPMRVLLLRQGRRASQSARNLTCCGCRLRRRLICRHSQVLRPTTNYGGDCRSLVGPRKSTSPLSRWAM